MHVEPAAIREKVPDWSAGKLKAAIDIDHMEDFCDELASSAAPVVRTKLIKAARRNLEPLLLERPGRRYLL